MNGFNLTNAATAVFGRIAAARSRRRTSRVIDGLPDHVLRDIGWSTERRQRAYRSESAMESFARGL